MTTSARWEGSTHSIYQLYILLTTPQDGVQHKYCTATFIIIHIGLLVAKKKV